MNFIDQAQIFATELPLRSLSIPVGHPLVGRIGLCVPGRGFQLWGMSQRSLEALLRDEERFRRNLLERLLYDERGAITTWDGVLNARAQGKADDRLYYKASQTTVANAWSAFFRSGGYPAAGGYGTGIPGGATYNVASTGAFGFKNPTDGDKKYLLNFGVQHLTGPNIVLLIDLLWAAGSISTNTSGNQTVNSIALTRYTDGVGVMATCDITTALGATASNLTLTYTNQAGTGSRTTTATAMLASGIVYRLTPAVTAPFIPLQAGDTGIRSIEIFNLSAAMGGGVVGLMLYKPLLLIPTLAVTTYVERSTPGMLGGITELVAEAGGNIGCLTVFVLTSTTSTGVQTYFLQACSG